MIQTNFEDTFFRKCDNSAIIREIITEQIICIVMNEIKYRIQIQSANDDCKK